ncbi:PKD domain-containing protein [Candidatus Woesearchaeota archaeon]|nr:PKD domain-containing protein [Candidatus Woesearchaeota archaeon]
MAYSQHSAACPVAAFEGDLVQLSPTAYDPDPEIGPAGRLIFEYGPPFNSEGKWQTMKGERGIFGFWVSVSDGELKSTNHSCVELFPNNRDPVLEPVPEVFVTRGESARIDATCTDPDGDLVEISFRFEGKDVAYIQYEPPGVYTVDVICTDGFGGIDSERTKLHILMPEVQELPKPAPAPVIIAPEPEPAPVPEPEVVEIAEPEEQEVELALPPEPVPAEHDIIEIHYPAECPPCPVAPADDNIEVVVYDTIYPVDMSRADSERFAVDEPASRPAQPTPVEEPVVIGPEPEKPCDDDLARKREISKVMGGCC